MLGLTLQSVSEWKFGLATGAIPGTLAFQVLLTIFSCSSHFSPPVGTGSLGFLHRLHAQQFDLLCFLFCPSLKGKDVPTLLQDCTSLCLDNHETGWETEILSPCPLPPLEKKNVRQSWVCSGAGVEQGLERIPLFRGCWMPLFWRCISKVTKAVLSEGGLRPRALFLNKCKTNKQTNAYSDSWIRDYLPDDSCMPCLGLGISS